jgi:hypothetical protein
MTRTPLTSITYENVSEKLIEHLPELREAYETEQKWWGGEKPGPHVVYGDVLNPYVDILLQSGDAPALRRVFEFLETLSCSEDQRVQELVAVTVCEHLGSDQERLRQAVRFMGPATLKHSRDVERFWLAT